MTRTNYNYREEMKKDIIAWFNDNPDQKKENYDTNYDTLWIEDSVTGNASGSYTFNRQQAKEYVIDNFDELCDAMMEFDCLSCLGKKVRDGEWEYLDVTIRCYLLGTVLATVRGELGLEV